MKSETYAAEDAVVESHWWFVCRRRLFARLIVGLGIDKTAPTLDVGTSSGTNLILLRDLGFSHVTGLDPSTEAVEYCARRELPPVRLGRIEAMPFENDSMHLILATDVLEHIPDDDAAMAEISRVLVSGGHVLISVPAFPSLWGLQDEVSHHLRRYRMKALASKVQKAGLEIEQSFHFNFLLFGPIWLARQVLSQLKPKVASENAINTPFINRAFCWIFGFDVAVAPWLKPPFGVSVLILARKP